jgi:uncharacterized membrane protein YphA (DoxX/SURF4 family)
MNRLLGWRGHAWLGLVARVYLAAVFLLACWHKILQPQSFAVDVATYQILPLALINLTAIVLPWVELASALLLLFGWRTRAAALLISAMMGMFLVAISIALARGQEMSCGCFASQGAAEDPISWRTVARDSGWLLLGLYVLCCDRAPLGIDRVRKP